VTPKVKNFVRASRHFSTLGSGYPFQSFCSCLTKRISTAIPHAVS